MKTPSELSSGLPLPMEALAPPASRAVLMSATALGAGLVLVLWAVAPRDGVVSPSARHAHEAVRAPGTLAGLEAPEGEAGLRQPVVQEARPELEPTPAGPALGQGAPARAFLADHYGPRWPEVQAKIEAWGQIDLDMPYFQRPWEEVEGQFVASLPMRAETRAGLIESRVQWPAEVTPEFLRAEFPPGKRGYEIDASDALAVDALVAPKNAEIAELAQLYTERVDAHVLDSWASGNYLRAPFTTGGLSDELGFHSMSTGGHGWAITITLTEDECPDIVALGQEIEARREERDRMVFAYLGAKARR